MTHTQEQQSGTAVPPPRSRRRAGRDLSFLARWRLPSALVAAFTVVFVFLGVWIFQYTTGVAQSRLESELARSAEGGAQIVDPATFTALKGVPAVPDPAFQYGLGYPDSPLYDEVVNQLYDIRRVVRDAKVYSYYKDPVDGRMYFSASGGALVPPPEGPVGVQFKVPVDEVVDDETYDYMERGLTATVNQADAYEDDYGTFISSYAPIRAADGTSVGAIGLDYPITYTEQVQRDAQKRLYPVLAISYIVLLALVVILSTTLTRPINRFTAATERIAAGEYNLDAESMVSTPFPQEIHRLAESFADMADAVKSRERALAREVQRLKTEIDGS